jgi:hypothetical protein
MLEGSKVVLAVWVVVSAADIDYIRWLLDLP